MDFKTKVYKGKSWSTESLKNVLDRLGVKTLEDAIQKERAKIKAEGFRPIETQHEPSSLGSEASKFKYAPPYTRLPYSDPD